ncbi:phosphatase PAP2 family protein, partial [bacterium]
MDDALLALTSFNQLMQNLGGWLTLPMKFFSFLWKEEFIMILLPAIYWCWDAVLGFRVGAVLMLGNSVNAILKLAFHTPRPYWINPEVKAFATESSFGMPSGHAQNATLLWGRLAYAIRCRWVTVVFIVIIFLIGVSRIYLGVHFITDVVAGWLIGVALLWIVMRLEKSVSAWLGAKPVAIQILWAFLSSLAVILLGMIVRASLANWQLPETWIATASLQSPGEPINPLNIDGLFTAAGTWWGMAAGYAWYSRRYGRFNAGGEWNKRGLRLALGLMVVLVLWYGLGQLFPRNADVISFVLRFIRYALVGVWVAAGAPWLFVRLKLAD